MNIAASSFINSLRSFIDKKILSNSFVKFYKSSIGKKVIVAVTGLALIGFLLGHMIGNLKIFAGAEKINSYAAWLHSMPLVLWGARIGLLACFFGHIFTTVMLVIQNKRSKGSRYVFEHTNKASRASRTMVWSGVIIICFVIYHILHYTVRFANDYNSNSYIDVNGNHDVYKMLIHGFSWWPASLFYIFSMALLCWHLSHGFASVFQTLGLRTDKTWGIIKATGYAYSLIIFVGNCSIPVSILAGWLT